MLLVGSYSMLKTMVTRATWMKSCEPLHAFKTHPSVCVSACLQLRSLHQTLGADGTLSPLNLYTSPSLPNISLGLPANTHITVGQPRTDTHSHTLLTLVMQKLSMPGPSVSHDFHMRLMAIQKWSQYQLLCIKKKY